MAEIKVASELVGRVWQIEVTPGAEVAEGDTLIVLESMKMENELKSPRDGIVHRVNVAAGDSVEQNKVLVTIA